MGLFDRLWGNPNEPKGSPSKGATESNSGQDVFERAKQIGAEPFPDEWNQAATFWLKDKHDAWCTCQGLVLANKQGSHHNTVCQALQDMLVYNEDFSQKMYASLLAGFVLTCHRGAQTTAAARYAGTLGVGFCRSCLAPIFVVTVNSPLDRCHKCDHCEHKWDIVSIDYSRQVGIQIRNAFAMHSIGMRCLRQMSDQMSKGDLVLAERAEQIYRALDAPGMLARSLLRQGAILALARETRSQALGKLREAARLAKQAEKGMKTCPTTESAERLLKSLERN
jgi:hypothetical protein